MDFFLWTAGVIALIASSIAGHCSVSKIEKTDKPFPEGLVSQYLISVLTAVLTTYFIAYILVLLYSAKK